jgi:hypothetical protein
MAQSITHLEGLLLKVPRDGDGRDAIGAETGRPLDVVPRARQQVRHALRQLHARPGEAPHGGTHDGAAEHRHDEGAAKPDIYHDAACQLVREQAERCLRARR